VAQRQLEVPDKNLNVSNEGQGMFLGRLNKIYGNKERAPTGKYDTNVGYIVE